MSLEEVAASERPSPAPVQNAEQWFTKRYSNVDPVIFVAQPSGKRLYAWEIAEAYAAHEMQESETLRLQLRDQIQEQAATIQRLKELLAAKDGLLVAYRLGNHKLADKALTQIEKAKAALGEELERK